LWARRRSPRAPESRRAAPTAGSRIDVTPCGAARLPLGRHQLGVVVGAVGDLTVADPEELHRGRVPAGEVDHDLPCLAREGAVGFRHLAEVREQPLVPLAPFAPTAERAPG